MTILAPPPQQTTSLEDLAKWRDRARSKSWKEELKRLVTKVENQRRRQPDLPVQLIELSYILYRRMTQIHLDVGDRWADLSDSELTRRLFDRSDRWGDRALTADVRATMTITSAMWVASQQSTGLNDICDLLTRNVKAEFDAIESIYNTRKTLLLYNLARRQL